MLLIALQVAIACLAVFGMYSLLKLICEGYLTPSGELPVPALCLNGDESIDQVLLLVDQAINAWSFRQDGEMLFIISSNSPRLVSEIKNFFPHSDIIYRK